MQNLIAQFLPWLDLTSYLCCLLLNSYLTTKRHPSDIEPSYIPIFRLIQSAIYPVSRSTDRSLFTWIIIYNYKWSDLHKIWYLYLTLVALHMCQISARSKYAFLSFCVCAKIWRKKNEGQKPKFGHSYLGNGWHDLLYQLWNVLQVGTSTTNLVFFG